MTENEWVCIVETVNRYDVVSGYLQLGMAEDAILELKCMPEVKQKTERYAELLLAAEMMQKDWRAAAETAKKLCAINSEETGYFIHAAYCMHELGETSDALEQLMKGPKSLLNEALYHYNLACYYAVLDAFDTAQQALLQAFELDPELREIARNDVDLAGLEF